MSAADSSARVARQHLIDPEICIRCNTCEATCPVGAITHDARNYVVRFEVCNACGACIAPCPTGAIDNWRHVSSAQAYSIDEQLAWDSLPSQANLQVGAGGEIPADVTRITSVATAGQGGVAKAPASAERPAINLFGIHNPAIAAISGNFRLTGNDASCDIRHLVLDFGATAF